MGWKKCTYEEIEALIKDHTLDMPWEPPEENEAIWKYEENDTSVAFVKLIYGLEKDKTTIYIDVFEVIWTHRGRGFGRRSISELLKELNEDVKLLAANKEKQKFWEKCGFKDDGITEMEIPMIYRRKRTVRLSL